jgi:tetratricopeptide (TPR) repeat protein
MKDERKEIDQNDLVELDFLERLAVRLPQDDEVLKVLGDLYTRVGRFEKGLETDHRLVALCPDDALVWYNLGCSLALLGKRDEALKALSRAVTLGYGDYEYMISDNDLRTLREERAFKTLIKRIAKGTPKVKKGHAGND